MIFQYSKDYNSEKSTNITKNSGGDSLAAWRRMCYKANLTSNGRNESSPQTIKAGSIA